MVWPILISVSLAPGSYFRLSANDAVATTSAAAMVTDFRTFACKPSLILALPLAARFAFGVAIAPSSTLCVTARRAASELRWRDRRCRPWRAIHDQALTRSSGETRRQIRLVLL